MSHYTKSLPGLSMSVQEVVDNLDLQVRQLLSHAVGLEEPACFYEKDRAVRTASSEQVRQPIYRDALQLW